MPQKRGALPVAELVRAHTLQNRAVLPATGELTSIVGNPRNILHTQVKWKVAIARPQLLSQKAVIEAHRASVGVGARDAMVNTFN